MKGLTSEKLNDDIGDIVHWRKSGTVVNVVDKTSMPDPPAPAWYIPSRADLFLHTTEAGVDSVNKVWDVYKVYDDRDMARVAGLLVHEAAHSRWSDWMTTTKIPRHLSPIVTMLEELRIEKLAVDQTPYVRKLLRASFSLLLGDTAESMAAPTKLIASHNWALLVGRSYSGVASPAEVETVDLAGRTLIGDDICDVLVDLIQEAIEGRGAALVDIAQEWIDLVGEDGSESLGGDGCHGEGEGEGTSIHVTSAPGHEKVESEDKADDDTGSGSGDDEEETEAEHTDGSGDGGDDDGDEPEDDSDPSYGDVDSVDSTKIKPRDGEILTRAVEAAKDEVVKDWKKDPAIELANPLDMATKVFGKKKARNGRTWSVKAASADLRREVTKAARALETLVLPAIAKSKVPGQLPPGRLRTREAVRASADRAAGRMTEAKMWTTPKRRHSHTKPVIVGIATDTSGSMRWAEQAVADFAYVMSNAGSRIGARSAAVTFGDEVDAITWPGEPGREVTARAANGGSEAFDEAMAALDGVLKLSHHNTAAKVLFIVSDGHLVRSGEMAKAERWMKLFDDAGVTVIWITQGHDAHVRAIAPKAHIKTVSGHFYDDGTVGPAMIAAALEAIAKMEGASF